MPTTSYPLLYYLALSLFVFHHPTFAWSTHPRHCSLTGCVLLWPASRYESRAVSGRHREHKGSTRGGSRSDFRHPCGIPTAPASRTYLYCRFFLRKRQVQHIYDVASSRPKSSKGTCPFCRSFMRGCNNNGTTSRTSV